MQQVLFAIIVLGSVLFLVYVTTRYIGDKAGKMMRGKVISVVDTINLGLDKHLHLIKAGSQFFMISSSGKNIKFLTDIKLDDFELKEPEGNNNIFNFKVLFEKYLNGAIEKKSSKEKAIDSKDIELADMSEKETFRLNLDRLRTITGKYDNPELKNGDGNTNDKI